MVETADGDLWGIWKGHREGGSVAAENSAAKRKLRIGPTVMSSRPIPPGPPQDTPGIYPERTSACRSGSSEASFGLPLTSNSAGGTDGVHSGGRRGRKIRVEGLRRPDQGVSHHRMVQQRRLVERSRQFGPQIVENGTPSAWRSARKKLRAGIPRERVARV